MKKANLEKIHPIDGSSFYMAYNKEPFLCHLDFWHFHPEFEIVYLPHGNGKRFVGSRSSRFDDGDLILLGPNIPHNAFNFGFESTGYEEYVIQFKGSQLEALTEGFPEFCRIGRLLAAAQTGLSVKGIQKHQIGEVIKKMLDIPPFQRLMQLFAVLREMSLLQEHWEDLQAKDFLSVNTTHIRRVEQVYQLIQQQFEHDLTTRQIAKELSMTESSFCRFFRQATGKSFKQALTEVRIQKACAMLLHSDSSVAGIASRCGFNNISLFNRFFKETVLMTPNQYRQSHSILLSA